MEEAEQKIVRVEAEEQWRMESRRAGFGKEAYTLGLSNRTSGSGGYFFLYALYAFGPG
jgi:hypothetical protein